MLKKVFALFMVIVLCLSMCACKKGDDTQTDPTTLGTTEPTQNTHPTKVTEPTKNTEPPVTTAPPETTEVTEPTEPPVVELSVSDWQLEKPNYLSYEDYFSVEREFANVSSLYSPHYWIKGGQKYYFRNDFSSHERLLVECYEPNAVYVIPNSEAYAKYQVAGADGHYGYLYNENQLVRIDLATGNVEKLLEGQMFGSYYVIQLVNVLLVDNLVAYYICNADNELTIGRLYLPTLNNEILYSMQGEFYHVSLTLPQTTQTIEWAMLNPEFINYVKAELADPNSKVQKGDYYDLSEIWKSEDAFDRIIRTPMMQHILQDEGNIRALLKFTYNLETKELTTQTGVVDNCFHGSGMPHDHYNPDITTAPKPELIMSPWTNLLNPLPDIVTADESAVNSILLPGVDSGRYLYGTDGKKLIDSPVSWAFDVGNGAIYISVDKQSICAINYKDGQSVELYRSAEGEITGSDNIYSLCRDRQWLVFCDGDVLMQIDLAAGKWRQLVSHPNIQSYYYIDYDMPTVYFEICAGLYGTGYTVNMETGELRDHYRL